jgi:hypothetical protein
LDYNSAMARVVLPIFGFLAAVTAAILLGVLAHDTLGISRHAVRIDALGSVAFIYVAAACATLLKLNR